MACLSHSPPYVTSSYPEFVKYQGLGNDFILIDNTQSSTPLYTPEQAAKLCDRHFGIGADGLIFALPGRYGCDYTMRIYNSDGSEPQMCGNGIRCLAKFLQEGLTSATHSDSVDISTTNVRQLDIWTNAGKIVATITTDGDVKVAMGCPILQAEKVPALLPTNEQGIALNAPLTALNTTYEATAISMGNPHSVIFVDDLETMEPPFATIGPILESHPCFPERVNTEFVQIVHPHHAKMKVWERGAGPTLACGTGACAVVVAGVLTGRLARECQVSLPGGDLWIHWQEEDNQVYMTGPAQLVFRGQIVFRP